MAIACRRIPFFYSDPLMLALPCGIYSASSTKIYLSCNLSPFSTCFRSIYLGSLTSCFHAYCRDYIAELLFYALNSPIYLNQSRRYYSSHTGLSYWPSPLVHGCPTGTYLQQNAESQPRTSTACPRTGSSQCSFPERISKTRRAALGGCP